MIGTAVLREASSHVLPSFHSKAAWIVQRWSSDGTELFFRNGNDPEVVEMASNGRFEIERARTLFTRAFPGRGAVQSVSYWLYDAAPDGQRFVTFEEEKSEPELTHLNLILNWAEELKRLVP